MTIVCPLCDGAKSITGRSVSTFNGKKEWVTKSRRCSCCAGKGTIVADKQQIKAEGRRMRNARIARNQQDIVTEASRYGVEVMDYLRFEGGWPVSDDVMRKLGAKP